MKNVILLLLLSLLGMSTFYAAPGVLQAAHGSAAGIVCIASHPSTTCPSTTPTIPGPPVSPGALVTVDILVSGSAALSSFDIVLLAPNNTVLVPLGVALTKSSVLTGSTEIVKCIAGVNKLSSSACPSTDTSKTIEYAVTGALTSANTVTGLLFSANFTVAADAFRTPIGFQTGCTNASVPNNICITISNGSKVAVPETFQTAKFSNQPYFDIQPSIGSDQVAEGDNDATQTLNVISLNTFGAPPKGSNVTLTTFVTSNSSSTPLPIFSLSPTSVDVNASNSGFSIMTITVPLTTPPGLYFLNITGTSGTLPANSVVIQLIVPNPDFQISLSPQNINFNVTAKGTSTITIKSVDSFIGNVTLSLVFSPFITAKLGNLKTSQTLLLKKDATNSTTVTVNSTIAGSYFLNVTGTSGPQPSYILPPGPHTTPVKVLVLDYQMVINPNTPLSVVNSSSAVESITFPATGFYNTTVRIVSIFVQSIAEGRLTGPSFGISVSCSPINMTIVSTGNTNGGNATNCKVIGHAVGDYLVTVTASSGVGTATSNHAASFEVNVIVPSFSITLSPSSVATVPVGGTATVTATLTGHLKLVSNITMSAPTISGPGSPVPTLKLNVTGIIKLNATFPNAGVLVTINAASNTPPGVYNMTIAASGTNTQGFSTSMLVDVVAVASPHNLGVINVSPSTTSATIGQKINILVEIENLGKLTENATIVAIVGDETVGQNKTMIASGHNYNTTIVWDTTSWSAGSYTIGAKVLAVLGQTNTTYSTLRFATSIVLTAANTSPFSSPYAVPLIIVAAIIIIAVAATVVLLPRRKAAPTQ